MQHPNIVQIYEFGESDGLPFIALEFCAGGSLADQLTSGPIPPVKAATLVESLARAMDAVHRSAIVHRDLKPANVLLAADGTLKITDFGLVKRSDTAGVTACGAVMGTPSYMAPEQARGEARSVGPAADIDALGAILYECFRGRPPFVGESLHDTITQVIEAEPAPLSGLGLKLPRDLETICLKCLQRMPARRYASAADLADDLHRFLVREPIQARPVGRVGRKLRRHSPVAILGASLMVLGLSIAGLIFVGRGDRPVASEAHREEVRDVVAELDRTDPGWRLEQLEEKRAVVPPDRNSSNRIAAAERLLPKGWGERFIRETLLQNRPWIAGAPLSPGALESLDDWLKGIGPALAEARVLAGLPEGRSPIDYRRDGRSTNLPHVRNLRFVAGLVAFDAVRQTLRGNPGAGLESCRASLNASWSLSGVPFALSQRVRSSVACGSAWDASWILGQANVPGTAFEKLQLAFEQEAAEPLLLVLARSERGNDHWIMSAISSGDLNAADFKRYGDESGLEGLGAIPTAQDVQTVYVWTLRHMTRLVAIARLPDHEQLEAAKEWDRRTAMAPKGEQHLIPEGRPIIVACLRHRALTRSAAVALAVEGHRLRSGQWPSNLDALGEFFPKIPADPYDGGPLRFRCLPDGVVVYTLGPDGQDDGGSIDLAKPGLGDPGTDLGFQLWDVSRRG